MRRIAVTGGTGFIGRHVVTRALDLGFAVNALTRTDRPPESGLTWIRGDLEDRAALEKLLHDADMLVHIAGQVRGANQQDFDSINVDGLARTLDAFCQGDPTRPVLLLSSLAAREPDLSFYAGSKRRGERLLESRGLPNWTILRPPAVYGPGDEELQPLFDNMLKGLGVHPGHAGRFSIIHVSDLTAAVMAWLKGPCGPNVLELDDGRANAYSWQDILDTVAEVTGRRVIDLPLPRGLLAIVARFNATVGRLFGPPMLTPGKVRELFHEDWQASNETIAEQLNWRPEISFEEGIRQLAAKQP